MTIENSFSDYFKVENKRFYRRVRSRLKKRLRSGSHINKTLIRKYNLKPTHKQNGLAIKFKTVEKWLTIKIPTTFSMIKDHNTTLRYLAELQNKLQKTYPKNLFFDHTEVEFIGLSASYSFDLFINEYREKWARKKIDIKIAGIVSDNKNVNNFLSSFGLLSDGEFDEIPDGMVDNDYKTKFETFKFFGHDRKSFLKAECAGKLALYFDKCLKHNNRVMPEDALGLLIDAFGEILGNAEEHSKFKQEDIVQWHAFGSFNKDSNYCRFSIINTGKTIYQNLSDETSTASEIIKEITPLIRKQMSFSRKMKMALSPEHEEPIWNVMALQDGISSKRTESGRASTRGQGLMDVIEIINKLRAPDVKSNIAIISGRSKVLIDFTYPIGSINIENETRRKIVFNVENDLKLPQDQSKVMLMNDAVQGTIITGRIKLKKDYLEPPNS